MIERIEGIVTDVIKHNDKHNVVTLYTRTRGRMAFLVPVGSSKTGRMRNSTLSLLAVVGADVNIRGGKELYTLRQVQPLRMWHGIYANPVKSSLLFFLTEFCNRLLRQYPADHLLWDYIIRSLEILDSLPTERVANFHLAFLIRLLPIVGIEPSASKREDDERFDLLSGEMIDPHHPEFLRRRMLLSEEESSLVPLFLRMNFRNMACYRLTRNQRSRLLDILLSYYANHLPIGTDFRSLPILRSLFD